MLSQLNWQADAACRDLPLDWFFPDVGPEVDKSTSDAVLTGVNGLTVQLEKGFLTLIDAM